MAAANMVAHPSESRMHGAPMPLAQRLWGLDWSAILPWQLEDVTVEQGTFDDALPFIAEHYAKIFGVSDEPARFLVEPMTPAKRRFGDEMDVFLFRADGRVIGVFMSHPSDWSTYYLRSTAILPEYRGRGVFARFMERIWQPLRDAGVQRVESDVSPANTAVVALHVRQGYMAASTQCSERWGLVIRFTKFLHQDNEDIFTRQFCAMKGSRKNT